MLQKQVSVIVPNFNHARYIKKRLDSVLSQTYQNFEVIILDDCSKDNSREIIEQYRHHPKVSHIIFNEQNSGSTFKQWKKGVEVAKGDWIWIAESDDWCEPTLLQELVMPLEQNDDIVISFCQSVLVTPENTILYTTKADKLSEIVDGQHFLRAKMLGVNHIINASMAIFNKVAFTHVPSGFEHMRYCGDWLLWTHLSLQGKVHISGKYLNYYLRHENNVATMAVKEGFDFLEGNQIFDLITKTISVSAEEKASALQIRSSMYFDREPFFLNDEIRCRVHKAMMALDPSMKGIMQQRAQSEMPHRDLSLPARLLRFIKFKFFKTRL